MDFNYEENEKIMLEFIEDCRRQIKDKFFSEDKITNEEIRKHREEMIDIKLNHTMRVVEDVAKMSMKMNLNIDFTKIVKVSALLHDIARFNQAVWADSFNDRNCSQFNGMMHAEYGYHLLYVNNKFKDFQIPKNYQFAISQAVKYHQQKSLTGDLNIRFENKKELNPEVLTGYETLNNSEKIIVATLVQMVRDVDMLDILYQHLTNEFPVIRPFVTYDVCHDNLSQISKHFGISEAEIMAYNKLDNDDISNMETIKIPTIHMDKSKLAVPQDIRDAFLHNIDLDLVTLQKRRDWTFITGMWWRLIHFINNINFTSNLELVKEKELLDKIYEMYPDEYKPLVEDIFTFTKEVVINASLKINQGSEFIKENTGELISENTKKKGY